MPDIVPFDYQHESLTLKGQIALPAAAARRPAVLVMTDALGLGSLVCRRARELADAGYVALATDMYGVGLSQATPAEAGQHFADLRANPERLRARALAGYDAVRALPRVDPDRIAAIGFCFGGQCVLELARSGADLAAVVSFHGLLTTKLPARPGAIKAKVLAITGALDPHVPMATAREFEKEMADAGADWQLTTYGQGWHAFADPEVGQRDDIPGVRYDALLDRLSWAQATELLRATLGSD